MGCIITYKLVCTFAPWPFALAATLLTYFCTNQLYYSAHEAGMSHGYSFFLYALFALSTTRILFETSGNYISLWIISLGILILIRQLNITALIFAAALVVPNDNGLRGFWGKFKRFSGHTVISGSFVGLLFVVLMWYWYYVTGHAVVFSYGYKGEHFEWDKLMIGGVLFSQRNGWLIYTPIMLPTVIMLLVGVYRKRAPAFGILIVLVVTLITYSAWWSWWLGAVYGHRGFIDLYALLAIPLAWLLRDVWGAPK